MPAAGRSRNPALEESSISRLRNYWFYSLGLALAWAILLTIFAVTKPGSAHSVLLAFLGFVIGWISTTIARYVYPPAKRWRPLATQSVTDTN